jgi:hypothetical protein
MKMIRFYNYHDAKKQLLGRERVPVGDWSFIEDMENTTTMAKSAFAEDQSKLKNLRALFPIIPGLETANAWFPTYDEDELWTIIQSWYTVEDDRDSWDAIRRARERSEVVECDIDNDSGYGSNDDEMDLDPDDHHVNHNDNGVGDNHNDNSRGDVGGNSSTGDYGSYSYMDTGDGDTRIPSSAPLVSSSSLNDREEADSLFMTQG